MLFSKIIKKKFDAVLGRYDGNPAYYYYSPADFKEIVSEPCDVEGALLTEEGKSEKITLKGAFYYYGKKNSEKLVVFDHGIGAGHLAYFKEIEYLARKGYTVYSYDHAGCVASEGRGIVGFAQGVNDLDHVLNALKKNPFFKESTVRLVGHSWGGYSAMNVAKFHPQVTHIVSLAGFLSAKTLVEQYIPKMFLKYSKEVMARERIHNPEYADLDARKSLLETKAKFLYLQSTDDKEVNYDLGYLPLKEALANRESETIFISQDHKAHSPHHTVKAAELLEELKADTAAFVKTKDYQTAEGRKAFMNRHNWEAITEEDDGIWAQIFDFLEK